MKNLTIAALTALLSAGAGLSAAQQSNPSSHLMVRVNGHIVSPSVQPETLNGVSMIPARAVLEQMGATVQWDAHSKNLLFNLDGNDVVLQVGSNMAIVDGMNRQLKRAPVLVGSETLVPVSFFQNDLKEEVTWNQDHSMLEIDTITARESTITTTSALHRVKGTIVSLGSQEILPVTLNGALSSGSSRVGDDFTVSLVTDDSNQYANLPKGTRIEGHVVAVEPMTGTKPGVVDVTFDHIDLPNGDRIPIQGSLMSLKPSYAQKDEAGIYRCQSGAGYNRMVWVGYGDGSGRMVGVETKRPLSGAAYMASLGPIQSQVPGSGRHLCNVSLADGTIFGVRIDRDAIFGSGRGSTK